MIYKKNCDGYSTARSIYIALESFVVVIRRLQIRIPTRTTPRPLGRTATVAVAIFLTFVASHPTVGEGSTTERRDRAFVITDSASLAPFTIDRVTDAVAGTRSRMWRDLLLSSEHARKPENVMPWSGLVTPKADGTWRPVGDGWSHVRVIAIVNRFDLTSVDYATCGEYRLIFSRRADGAAKRHVALEASLPNPAPTRGNEGCAEVAAFWRDLAVIESAEIRAQWLERFFFRGLSATKAVLDPHNFAENGRFRISEISDDRPTFSQFEVQLPCSSTSPCVAVLSKAPLANVPDATLFDADTRDGRASEFRHHFLQQVASLAVGDVNRLSMRIGRKYSMRDAEAHRAAFNYLLRFRRSLRLAAGREFHAQLTTELAKLGSALKPEDIIERAETQTCAGCHAKPGAIGGGMVFPTAFEQGEHITDESMFGAARLSPALEEVFVPYRIAFLDRFLEAVYPLNATVPRSSGPGD